MVRPHNDVMLVNRQTEQRYLSKDLSDRAKSILYCAMVGPKIDSQLLNMIITRYMVRRAGLCMKNIKGA